MDTIAVGEVELGDVGYFIHGTTIVINAITERQGVKAALVTTAGFRDVLEIGRGNRPDLNNMRSENPRPFVPRRWRLGLQAHNQHDGRVRAPLPEHELDDGLTSARAAP